MSATLTERLRGRQSPPYVLAHEPPHEVLPERGYTRPGHVHEVWVRPQDRAEDARLGARPERPAAAQEDVRDDAHAPDVGLVTVAAVEHLGRDVVGASHYVVQLCVCAESIGRSELLQRGSRVEFW